MVGLREMAWGPWLVYLMLGSGALLSLLTLVIQLRGFARAVGLELGRSAASRPSRAHRTLLAGGAGMGSVAGAAMAVTAAGPGAVFWLWIATVLGMAITFSEATLAAASRRDPGETAAPGAGAYIGRAFGPVGPIVGGVFALATIAAALTAGGLFQAHQGAELLRASFGTLSWVGVIALSAAAAPFVLASGARTRMLSWIPGVVALYVLVLVAAVGADVTAAGEALATIVDNAFGPTEAAAGAGGAAVALAIQHGLLRATFAGESGLGSAAHAGGVDGDRPIDAGLRAMLVPLITSGVIGTLTALLVITGTGPRRMAESRMLPLELHESRGLRPSAQVGQTVILPENTTLEPNKQYPVTLRSNPRGHKVGIMSRDRNAVLIPGWGIAANVDTLVFRAADPVHKNSAGWDVRVAVTREKKEFEGQTLYELLPTNPDIEFAKLVAQRKLDGPYVVLDDFEFVGTVARAASPEAGLGEHLAMFEQRDAEAPDNPKLHEFFRIGYRGPYIGARAERPPWALPSAEDVHPALGSVLRLRMQSPPRGASLARLTQLGAIEAPPWDFLLGTTTAVVRHDVDPAQDILVPIRGQLAGDRLRFESTDSGWKDFRIIAETMDDYSGPYLLVPPYDFDVEVHGDARFPGALAGRRSLVPHHELGEPAGPIGELPYHPHPGEVVATDMEGPYLAADGVTAVAASVAARLGAGGRAVLAILGLLLAITTMAVWSDIGARTLSHYVGATGAIAFRAVFVIAAASAALLSFAQVLELSDVAIAAVAAPNLAALLALTPKLVAELRGGLRPAS